MEFSPSPFFSCSRVIAGLFVLLLGACRSNAPVSEGPALPFHVALSPTEIEDYEQVTVTPIEAAYSPPAEGDQDGDMRLSLTADDITGMLETQLAPAFVKLTRLSLTDEDREELAGKEDREKKRYWAAKARSEGANLLLSTKLLIDPEINHERNEKFWLNLPLFLLGGPMCYFVGDRSYTAEVGLEAEFFEITKEEDDIEKLSLLPLPLRAKFEGADLRFLDRADSAGDYALSILIPAGFLAPKTDKVEEELEDRLPGLLGQQLKAEEFAKRALFEQNSKLGAFKLASLAEPIKRNGRLIIPVQELPDGSLLRYELSTDSQSQWGENGGFGEAGDGGLRLIDADVQLPEDASYLNVTVVEANANRRSYTFEIEGSRSDG